MRRALLAFSGLYVALTLTQCWAKPLWFDELFTFYISRLPAGSIARAVYHGPELNPPLYYASAHLSMAALGQNSFGVRLPAMIGFWAGCVCLALFIARRSGPAAAMAAALFPMATFAYFHATDARPYALVFGGGALAALCWQRARERPVFPAGLAAGLGIALLSHTYAVLLYPPLAGAELVRWRRTRRFDPRTWIAMAIPALALASYLPLFRSSRTLAQHTWAAPTLAHFADTLRYLFPPLFWIPLALAALAAVVRARRRKEPAAAPPAEEWCLAALLALLPVAAFLLGRAVTGFYHFRYAIPFVAGLALLAGLALAQWSARGWRAWIPAAVMLGLWLWVVGWTVLVRLHHRTDYPERLPAACAAGAGPVAVSDGLVYLPLTYYQPAEPFVYLYDPAAAARYTGNNSVDLGLLALAQWAPLRLPGYAEFVARHPRFLAYGKRGGDVAWLLRKLEADGAKLEPVECGAHLPLYRVTMPPTSPVPVP